MLATGLAQLRFAASLALGFPFSAWSLDRLCAAARDTRREFGTIEAGGGEALGVPTLDEATRQEVQIRRFRAQAGRAARETAYYGPLFAGLGLDPRRLRWEDIARLPPTSKIALRDDPDAFVRHSARPVLRAATTGTTGPPASVHFSAYELRTIAALGELAHRLSGHLDADDIVLLATSSRATLGNLGLAGACARLGALVLPTGQIDPARTLATLATRRDLPGKKRRVSALSTYPSYLGELVELGLALGYRPENFELARIFVGGEILTAGLRARCKRLFGPVELVETYALTETAPFGGILCPEGHLHFDLAHGLLEVLDPETGAPVGPGGLGTIVATPFPPFRDTTILLRYDTEDLVRPAAGPPACPLRHLPATTPILGKLRHAVRHDDGWTTPREVLEAIEALEAVPLPARYGILAVPGGVAVEVVARAETPETHRLVAATLLAHGVPLRALRLVTDRTNLRAPLPRRCDMREA